MATTHIIVGLFISLVASSLFPISLPMALFIGGIGGLAPDFDIFIGTHRKTFHYPIYGTVLALLSLVVLFFIPTSNTVVFMAIFLVSFSSHCLTDIVSCGLEKYPWKRTSQKAVYDHYHNKWIKPRYWVAYDGAKSDFLLTIGGGLLFMYLTELYLLFILLLMGIAGIYTLLRKRLPDLEDWLVERVPIVGIILD